MRRKGKEERVHPINCIPYTSRIALYEVYIDDNFGSMNSRGSQFLYGSYRPIRGTYTTRIDLRVLNLYIRMSSYVLPNSFIEGKERKIFYFPFFYPLFLSFHFFLFSFCFFNSFHFSYFLFVYYFHFSSFNKLGTQFSLFFFSLFTKTQKQRIKFFSNFFSVKYLNKFRR